MRPYPYKENDKGNSWCSSGSDWALTLLRPGFNPWSGNWDPTSGNCMLCQERKNEGKKEIIQDWEKWVGLSTKKCWPWTDNCWNLVIGAKGVHCTILPILKCLKFSIVTFFFFWSFLPFSWAIPAAYGCSQAKGLIGDVAAGLRQSHSNVGS